MNSAFETVKGAVLAGGNVSEILIQNWGCLSEDNKRLVTTLNRIKNRTPVNAGNVYLADGFSGVDPTGTYDSKAGLQVAIDAIATAGGGTLMLSAGKTYLVEPLATGIGLLLRTGVRLAGLGTLIFAASTASAAYTGISPYGHNTTTTAYGAHEMDIQDIGVGCDDESSVYTHSLIGINHCPRARIRGVRLLGAYYHGIEVNKSRHVQIRDCHWSGNYRSSQLQLDIGSSGVISTSGAAGTNYTVEDIVIDGNHFGPRDSSALAHVGAGFTSIELTHTSSVMILRNVRITNNTFYAAVEDAATASTQRAVIGSPGSATAELTGVVVQRNHFISLAGTGNAYGLYITQASSALIRGIDFSHNTFTGGWKSMVYISGPTGGESALLIMTTATEFPEISGIRIIGNTATLRLNANGVASGARVIRCFSVSGVADAVISGNVVTLDNVIDANWTSGSFVATTPCHFILANHVRDLTLEDNRFSVLLTSVSFQFYGIVVAVCGFEASGISYNQRIRGNNLTAANSTGLLYAGYVHSSSVLRSAWPNPPKGRGAWENNVSTNAGSSRGATFFWPIGGGSNGIYTYGLPDWRPGYERIGEKIKSASAPGGGWRALAGTAFASLNEEEKHHWQYQLAQGTTALPTETDIYVRLSGSEQNPIALHTSPP